MKLVSKPLLIPTLQVIVYEAMDPKSSAGTLYGIIG